MAMTGFAYTVVWRDFTARVPSSAGAGAAAFVSTSFAINTPWNYVSNGGVRVYKIVSVACSVSLNRARMWARTTGRTDALLRHEQGHFDISALLIRQADQEMTALLPNRYDSEEEINDAMSAVRTPLLNLIAQLQSSATVDGSYDVSTNHGLDTGTQSQWNRAFTACRGDASGRLEAALTSAGISL